MENYITNRRHNYHRNNLYDDNYGTMTEDVSETTAMVTTKDWYTNSAQIENSASPSITNSVGRNANNNRNDVLIIQNLLRNLGYPLSLSGTISDVERDPTVLSVFNFQSNNNLRITGIIQPNDETYIRLVNLQGSSNSLQESDDESLHQPYITNAFTFMRNARNPDTLNVIFEGDSWLDYPVPNVLDLYDTVRQHNQRLNLNSLHLAKFGETTSDMLADSARFRQYLSSYRIDRIYFSGGGNDVFPQLGTMLNPGVTTFNNSFFSDPTKLAELRTLSGDALYNRCVQYKGYINTVAFHSAVFNTTAVLAVFRTIINNYMAFGNLINQHCTPNLIFYMHSYDYPLYKLGVRPNYAGINIPFGPWIKPAFDSLGITDPILQTYIIIRLIDYYYEQVLLFVKFNFRRYGYRFQTQIIDYRGLLNSSNYWRDEIHPNSLGATRLATRVNF